MSSSHRGHNFLRGEQLNTVLRCFRNASAPQERIRANQAEQPDRDHQSNPVPGSSHSPAGTPFPMLIGFVMVFALLAVGFGYVVFANTATSGGIFWDLGFLAFSLAFLVTFVAVIWNHASTEFSQGADSDSSKDD